MRSQSDVFDRYMSAPSLERCESRDSELQSFYLLASSWIEENFPTLSRALAIAVFSVAYSWRFTAAVSPFGLRPYHRWVVTVAPFSSRRLRVFNILNGPKCFRGLEDNHRETPWNSPSPSAHDRPSLTGELNCEYRLIRSNTSRGVISYRPEKILILLTNFWLRIGRSQGRLRW